jgi:hypothetical protein
VPAAGSGLGGREYIIKLDNKRMYNTVHNSPVAQRLGRHHPREDRDVRVLRWRGGWRGGVGGVVGGLGGGQGRGSEARHPYDEKARCYTRSLLQKFQYGVQVVK